jgi:hypothetical protein
VKATSRAFGELEATEIDDIEAVNGFDDFSCEEASTLTLLEEEIVKKRNFLRKLERIYLDLLLRSRYFRPLLYGDETRSRSRSR